MTTIDWGSFPFRQDSEKPSPSRYFPSHAFEVQVGGNFYEALAKLKHAYDKWKSKPVLVTTEKYEREAHALLTGSFHEIRHVISIVNWRTIVSLYRLLRRTWKLREEVGLR